MRPPTRLARSPGPGRRPQARIPRWNRNPARDSTRLRGAQYVGDRVGQRQAGQLILRNQQRFDLISALQQSAHDQIPFRHEQPIAHVQLPVPQVGVRLDSRVRRGVDRNQRHRSCRTAERRILRQSWRTPVRHTNRGRATDVSPSTGRPAPHCVGCEINCRRWQSARRTTIVSAGRYCRGSRTRPGIGGGGGGRCGTGRGPPAGVAQYLGQGLAQPRTVGVLPQA